MSPLTELSHYADELRRNPDKRFFHIKGGHIVHIESSGLSILIRGNQTLGDCEDNLATSQNGLVITDGMGGTGGGEYAAVLALRQLKPLIDIPNDDIFTQQVPERFIAAQNLIRQESNAPDIQNMDTTAALCYWGESQQRLYYAHTGNSKLYLLLKLRDNSIYALRINEDHDLVFEIFNLPDQKDAPVKTLREQIRNYISLYAPDIDKDIEGSFVRFLHTRYTEAELQPIKMRYRKKYADLKETYSKINGRLPPSFPAFTDLPSLKALAHFGNVTHGLTNNGLIQSLEHIDLNASVIGGLFMTDGGLGHLSTLQLHEKISNVYKGTKNNFFQLLPYELAVWARSGGGIAPPSQDHQTIVCWRRK